MNFQMINLFLFLFICKQNYCERLIKKKRRQQQQQQQYFGRFNFVPQETTQNKKNECKQQI